MRRALTVLTISAGAVDVGLPSSAAARPDHRGRDGLIVCTSDDVGGHAQLYEFRPDGSRLRRISDISTHHGAATWAPDGCRIVFERFHPASDDGLWSMRDDGTGLRRLTRACRLR